MSNDQKVFREMLGRKGLKVTKQRLLVLEALSEHRGTHMTAENIYDLIRQASPKVGLATVYRTVQLLLEMQLVDRVNLDDGCVRYEIGHSFFGGKRHSHHHLICKTCGKVLSFDDDLLEEVERQVEENTGFHIVDHELKIYGQCKECSKEI